MRCPTGLKAVQIMNIDKTCTLIWEGIENVMSSVLLLTMRMLDVGKEKSRRFLEKKKEEMH